MWRILVYTNILGQMETQQGHKESDTIEQQNWTELNYPEWRVCKGRSEMKWSGKKARGMQSMSKIWREGEKKKIDFPTYIFIFAWNVPLISISNFLEEISRHSHSIVFLYFFALILRKAFLSLLAILWNSAFKWVVSFSPLPFIFFFSQLFVRPPQTAILHFAFLFLGGSLPLYNFMNPCP